MAVNSSDLAVIGHFSMDTLLLPAREKPFNILGGAVAYTSFAARRLDASVSVISRVGSDFPQAYLWLLEQEGIDTTGILRYSEENTTSFELAYTQDFTDRILKLKSKGQPLTLGDIPKVFHVKASHIGPIANEVPYEVVEEIKKHSDTLSIDPQGMLRSFDKEGNVVDNGSIDNEVFSLVNIYKSS